MKTSIVSLVQLALLAASLVTLPLSAATYTWNSTGAGNWSDVTATGWNTGSGRPSAAGDTAIFSQNFGADRIFTIDVADATLGSLSLVNTTGNRALNLTRTGTNTLTFDTGGSAAATLAWGGSLNIDSTHSTISVPLFLNNDLVATGSTALTISGAITGAGKKITVNSTATAPAQLRLSGNNTALTGGIVINRNSQVTFGSINSLGGGGAGSVYIAAGAAGTLSYNPASSTAIDAAIAKIDPASAGLFGFGIGANNSNLTYAIDLSSVTLLRFGAQYSTLNINAGSSLAFDFTNNGNNYALGGHAVGAAILNLNVANYLTGAHNLDLRPQTLNINQAQDYTGTTTLSANPGDLINPSGTTTTLSLSDSGALSGTTAVTVNRLSQFTITNATANLADRLNDSASLTMNGGNIRYIGSASADSSETFGALILGDIGQSGLRIDPGSGHTSTLTSASLTRAAGVGTALVYGLGLGADSTTTSNVSRILFTAAPTLVGTTAATATGINAASKNTVIVPYLVGEAIATSGGLGTVTGTANTFLTNHAATGLRPLNPADEFTQNAIVAGNNTYITGATTAAATTNINSLVVNGANLALNNSVTLTNDSGAVLFVSNHQITGANGTLAFGSREALVTVNSGISATIGAHVAGTAGFTKSGLGTLTLGNTNTYTGDTTITNGLLALASNATLNASSKVNVRLRANFDVSAKTTGYTFGELAGAGTVKGLSGQTLTIATSLAAGDNGIGTLTFSAGNLSLTDGARIDFEIGGTTAAPLSDLVALTGVGGTVSLSGNYTLNLFNLGALDPLGKTFVLIDADSAISGGIAGTWLIDYGTTSWSGGLVGINALDNTQLILTGLTFATVPEPAAAAAAAGLLTLALAACARPRRLQKQTT